MIFCFYLIVVHLMVRSADAALTLHSSCLVHISETCSYLSISVKIRAYACMRAFTVHILIQCVSDPNLSLYGWGGPPGVRVARYWQFITDTYDIHRYEQDMLM